ncbi:hypothetical protein GJ744_002748 [Endocarpon pusillum]|uniref:Glycosyl transferase CAP10 domain-containing protein n=1 Tax=Endocarpon pusillum TaxID=364733 RepID=A0A8H7E873_9EURO|nr:hypothetical protein GJ744_002748 [Endocarpon pusillum]
MAPRRFSTYLLLVGFFCVLLFLYSSRESVSIPPSGALPQKPSSVTGKVPKFNVPSFHFSFRTSSHKPPEQRNSTSGGSSWYSDWTWLNPFSSSITLDENRSVLPPLAPRPPVYTYYDSELQKDKNSIKVDQELLLTWRRAWWAHGFRPVVLGRAEARKNLLFERMQGMVLSESLDFELNRWLAWGHMGTGLLASWHCVPMGAGDDSLLTYLRREILSSSKTKTAKTILEVLNLEWFRTEQASAIAQYDSATITGKYPALAEKIVATPDGGRLALNTMINSHLHTTWQNVFSTGIAVLKPLPAHTTALIAPSLHLANLLAQCPESLIPSSCPPNRPKCSPCVSSRVQVTTPPSFRNTSSLYSIGTVPHPYTMITLNNQSAAITVRHIRRHTARDPWLLAVTKDILGSGRGGPSRVVSFKEVVASEYGRSRSLWLTTEKLPAPSSESKDAPLPEEWLAELDWHFGFSIPRAPIPHDIQLAIEVELLDKARRVVNTKDTRLGKIRNVAEAWNMADTEAWRFTRAYRARSVVEKLKWEEEERGYGAEGRGKGRWWRM